MRPEDMYDDKFGRTYTDDEVKEMWPQACGELLGFSNALARGNTGITAAQLRMACRLAQEAYDARYKKETVE